MRLSLTARCGLLFRRSALPCSWTSPKSTQLDLRMRLLSVFAMPLHLHQAWLHFLGGEAKNPGLGVPPLPRTREEISNRGPFRVLPPASPHNFGYTTVGHQLA